MPASRGSLPHEYRVSVLCLLKPEYKAPFVLTYLHVRAGLRSTCPYHMDLDPEFMATQDTNSGGRVNYVTAILTNGLVEAVHRLVPPAK